MSGSSERHFRFQHPELGEVPACLGFLRPESRAEAIDLAEGHAGRLQVELARLGQVGLLPEIVGFEKGGGPLAGGGGEHGAVDENVSALIEEVPAPLADLVADPEQGVGAGGAQPEVAVIQEELRAVVLGSDGIVLGGVEDPEVLQSHFVASGGPGFLPDGPPHLQGGLLSQGAARGEDFGGDLLRHHHALEIAGPVPHHQEPHLPRLPAGVEPAPHHRLLPLQGGEVADFRVSLHAARLPLLRFCRACAPR
jgi:hypothetical protein